MSKEASLFTPRNRQKRPKASDYCTSIVNLMAVTERARPRDAAVVMIGAELWKRIYLNARKGAKS